MVTEERLKEYALCDCNEGEELCEGECAVCDIALMARELIESRKELLAYRDSGALGALTRADAQLAHQVACVTMNPTEDWEKKGRVSFDKCKCAISKVRAAIAKLEAIEK